MAYYQKCKHKIESIQFDAAPLIPSSGDIIVLDRIVNYGEMRTLFSPVHIAVCLVVDNINYVITFEEEYVTGTIPLFGGVTLWAVETFVAHYSNYVAYWWRPPSEYSLVFTWGSLLETIKDMDYNFAERELAHSFVLEFLGKTISQQFTHNKIIWKHDPFEIMYKYFYTISTLERVLYALDYIPIPIIISAAKDRRITLS